MEDDDLQVVICATAAITGILVTQPALLGVKRKKRRMWMRKWLKRRYDLTQQNTIYKLQKELFEVSRPVWPRLSKTIYRPNLQLLFRYSNYCADCGRPALFLGLIVYSLVLKLHCSFNMYVTSFFNHNLGLYISVYFHGI